MKGGSMEELVFIQRNEAVTDSLIVAEYFKKSHDKVVRAIDNLIKGLPKNGESNLFNEVDFVNESNGHTYRKYIMTRDGFSLLAMGFTGKKALQWKLRYIEEFNTMEKALMERKNEEYVNARKNGILTRKSETDMLKKLVEYAEAQGSTHANMLYVTYTKLVNKLVGVKTRTSADARQLKDLETLERVILSVIDEGIGKKSDYHEIYQECKKKCELISEIAHFGDYSMLRPLPT
jgi:Rha family phage regulatory protein